LLWRRRAGSVSSSLRDRGDRHREEDGAERLDDLPQAHRHHGPEHADGRAGQALDLSREADGHRDRRGDPDIRGQGVDLAADRRAHGSGFFVGTSKSHTAVRVSNTFEVITLDRFFPPLPIVAITAMQDGRVAVTYKDNAFGGGSYIYRNNGSLEMGGGSESFLAGNQNASAPPSAAPALTSALSSTALRDAQGHPVTNNGKPVVRDSAGAIIREGAQVVRSTRR
jgi:hypothetical protein